MDPTATLLRLRTAVHARDFADAVDALNAYYRWRLKGGFEPTGGDERADRLANILADSLESLS